MRRTSVERVPDVLGVDVVDRALDHGAGVEPVGVHPVTALG